MLSAGRPCSASQRLISALPNLSGKQSASRPGKPLNASLGKKGKSKVELWADPVIDSEYRKTDVELARSQEKVSSLKKETTMLRQEIGVYKSQIKDKDMIIALMSKEKNKA